MGRHYHFKMGSFYRTSDRTGFPQRAEITRKQWNNIYVEEAQWEPRQPQDLVRGVIDKQSVPEPRPLGPNIFVGPIAVQTTANVGIGATVIPVQTVFGFSPNDPVGLMLDSGVVFHTTALAVGASTVTLTAATPYTAASGNLLFDYAKEPQIV